MGRCFAALCLLGLLACTASHRPPAYLSARAGAQRAYAHGRYEDAATAWTAVAGQAALPGDRDEALFWTAWSLQRAKKLGPAVEAYRALLAQTPPSSYADRATFELARIEYEQGEPSRGAAQLTAALERYPDSGSARSAVRTLSAYHRARGGPAAVIEWTEASLSRVDGTKIAEWLHYEAARALEAEGKPEAARDRYLHMAEKYPYPQGGLWDDALWHAARLTRSLGDPGQAVAILNRLLAERETSEFQGSYLRSRYVEARLELAAIYEQELHDLSAARQQLEAVWATYEDSRLRDDARWREALLALRAGEAEEACRLVRDLADTLPQSRYARCVTTLCPANGNTETTTRPCSKKAVEEVAAARAR